MSLEHSRALLLASKVSDSDEQTLLERQEHALITVCLDENISGALLTARVLLTTLRRLPGRLALDRTGLNDSTVNDIVQAVTAIDSTRSISVIDGPDRAATVQLAVELHGRPNVIRVVPDGYGAQLAGDPSATITIGQPANALGSIFAAALAAAEAFKVIVVDKESRRTLHKHLTFCPVTLSDDTTVAPPLGDYDFDAAIVGNGAVGTAIALILSEMRLGGHITLCDPENYDRENRGTYSLGGEREAKEKPPKVDLVSALLETAGYETTPVDKDSTELIARIDSGAVRMPKIVLTGLDNIQARRETQLLFPDHLIDAGTSDTSIGLHYAIPTGPCLRCFFPESTAGPDPIRLLSNETGLPANVLRQGDKALTSEHLEGLTPVQKERLKDLVGTPICGLADAVRLTDASSDGYLPSVPFVSQMAACLAVGRLVAVILGLDLSINFFQFDALQSPVQDGDSRKPVADCYCQQRATLVQKLRAKRRGA